MKLKLDTLDFVVIAILAFAAGIVTTIAIISLSTPSSARVDSERESPGFITFRQLQQDLVDRGHDIKVDGIVGPNTLAAWEKEIGNDSALQYFTLTGAALKGE